MAVSKKKINPSGSPYYSDHVRSLQNVIFLHFWMLLLFSLTSYPAEIAYRMASLAWIALLELRLAEQPVSLRVKLSIPLGSHA